MFINIGFGALIVIALGLAIWTHRSRQRSNELTTGLDALTIEKDRLTTEVAQHQILLTERARQVEEKEQARIKLETSNIGLAEQVTLEKQQTSGLQTETSLQQKRITELSADNQTLKQQADALQKSLEAARIELQKSQTTLEKERSHNQEQLKLLQDAKTDLTNQFKAISAELLELNAKKMTDVNQENLSQVLNPLRERLTEYQGKVEALHTQGGRDAEALRESIRNMVDATKSVGQEATNLTNALKGSTKAQGNFGELILESLLEQSDLKKGQEYEIQENVRSEEGRRLQPDVIIHMPQGRDLVIDSKMSLVSYEEYCAAESDEQRSIALKATLTSIRSHVKGLSSKNYQTALGLQTVDYVIMFVPIEGAYLTAVNADDSLHMEAWNQNVIISTRTTLLMMLRIVSGLWRQAEQTRNAQEIARRGAEFYDKLTAFTTDLLKIGTQIKQTEATYESAVKKLSEGRGNVIRQAELLRDLGVKPSKQMPDNLTARDSVESEHTLLEPKDTGNKISVETR